MLTHMQDVKPKSQASKALKAINGKDKGSKTVAKRVNQA